MSRRIGWTALALSCILYLGDLYLLIVNGRVSPYDPTVPYAAVQDFGFVIVATLALVIIRSQPSNRVGWWIMLIGITWPLEAFTTKFVAYGLDAWGPTVLVTAAAWLLRWVWIAGQINIPFTLLYYPNGELPSRRWRPVAIGIWAVTILTFTLAAFAKGPTEEFPTVSNPVGFLPPFDGTTLLSVGAVALLSILPVVGLISLIARYRKSSIVVRQQLKVILWVAIVSSLFFGSQGIVDNLLDADAWSLVNTGFTLFVVGAITAGIVRYKLFDIDRLISRTVSYAVVGGLLAASFFGLVTIATTFLPSHNPLVTAASTLTVAALFNPLRRRVRRLVDRRFNRSRYDAERVVDEFADSLRAQVNPERVVDDWVEVVAQTMQPVITSIWVKEI